MWPWTFRREVLAHLCGIERLLVVQIEKASVLMATTDELLAEVAEQTTIEGSAVLLLDRIGDLLEEAQTDPAKLTQAIDLLRGSRTELGDAIVRNTPAETPTPEPPPEG